ncbi:cytochrome P450 2F2 [Nematolebias whitei]|uniref:cytochrome P450 2F2 n=1 Tax=Nematolebias whitei TaxID=451745 RepID=UPI00189B3D2C|nr:cytochrome P450 2F2 [Nematolebias whitei]
MKEAMVVKATDFAGRPQDLFINDLTQSKGMILADYGSFWRDHRRFALKTLKNFGLGKKSMEERIHEETKFIIKTLDKSIGKTLSPQVMFHFAASNIICKVLFGIRYEYDDETIKMILRQSYGYVYSLFIGSKPAVVINGFKTMKEAMAVKAIDFAGRPQDLFINDLTQSKGMILADYGSFWRDHRRFVLKTLKNFGLGKKSMEERIHEEIKFTIKTLEKSIGKTLSPQVMFHLAASNIICKVLFGTRYEYDDKTIKNIVQCIRKLNQSTGAES